MGFGAAVMPAAGKRRLGDAARVPAGGLPFGMIPEFIGRLPVIATLEELDERALISILTEPRNALVKQYQKLFEFEEVRLRFTDGALGAMARQALVRKSGARGLRAILETIMLDMMYDIPSREDVEEVVVSEEVVEQSAEPLLVLKHEAESA
jgi:ATP-dependent Clp protease ATP-binding subunit ClpX